MVGGLQIRPLASRISPSCSGWPTRPGCSPTRSWPRRACGRCWPCTAWPDGAPASASASTGHGQAAGRSPSCIDGCARHGIPAIGLWRDRSQAYGAGGRGAADARAGLRSPACAAAAFSRRPTPPAARAALDDNRRAIDEAAALGADSWCWSAAGCRRDRGTCPARGRMVPTGIAAILPVRARRRRDRWRSSRCTRCTPPTAACCHHARPGARPVRRARRRASGVGVDTYHVWWDPDARRADRPRRRGRIARLPRLRLAGADHATSLLDRGMMGDGVIDFARHPRAGRGGGLSRADRGGDHLRAQLVGGRPG